MRTFLPTPLISCLAAGLVLQNSTPALAQGQPAQQPGVIYTQPQQQPGVVYTQPTAQQPAPQPAPTAAPSQEDGEEHKKEIRKANNVVFVELGGNGLVYSINYERVFGDSDFSLRGGFSFISVGASGGSGSSNASLITLPVLGNYYVGGRDHKLQLGGGLTFMYASVSSGGGTSLASVSGFVPAPTLALGYRYLPARGGFTFFIGFTPFIIPGGSKVLFPWAGMSFGGAF